MHSCEYGLSKSNFSRAEQRAIDEHKYFLSLEAGRDVGDECAIRHWLQFHARRWRHHRLQEEMSQQREEIMRYKWIASEQAGRDLGSDAVNEWISKFAPSWRAFRDDQE
jgi:hypothetical protein